MIHWLVQTANENPDIARGAPPPDLLSEREAAQLATLRVIKRRRDWLLGRWTAKALLQQALAEKRLSLTQILIDNDADGAPFASIENRGRLQRLDWSLSISHSHGAAFCAAHPASGREERYAIGADLEFIEQREANFVQDYFTAVEAERVSLASPGARDAVITGIWSAKEAALKALRTGLRLSTRRIECLLPGLLPADDVWHPFTLHAPDEATPGVSWSGWWRRPVQHPDFVMTLVIKTEESDQ
ncbi:MAG: 4'-phosphopantetheinyl transferase superfamily protein [Caldilineaceae bacterium]|nr:4'-phosphopantetheinyl transferase superfamily protein [Caldilineaceae bacterium]